jgi:hypothetical protein
MRAKISSDDRVNAKLIVKLRFIPPSLTEVPSLEQKWIFAPCKLNPADLGPSAGYWQQPLV